MQFNPSDKSISLIADIDFLLFGTSATFNTNYSLEDRTRNLNLAWDEAVAEMYKADPNWNWDDSSNANFPLATMTTVAGQDHYTLLDEALVIHRVRMKNQAGVFQTLDPVLRRELSDSELSSTGSPQTYYKMGGAIFPIPIPTFGFAEGIEIEFQRGANHFLTTDTTKSPGFNPQFHRILSVGAAHSYCLANNLESKATRLDVEKEKMRKKLVEHYQLRSPDERPQMKLPKRSLRSYGF